MKKLLAIFMALIMVLSMTTTVWAETSTECQGDGCTHEAAIGTTHYDSFSEAVKSATEGQTVVVLKNVTTTDDNTTNNYSQNVVNKKFGLTPNANITIDLGGNTWTVENTYYAVYQTNNVAVTIQNGIVDDNSGNGFRIINGGLTVAGNAEIAGNAGIVLYPSESPNKVTLNIYGKVSATGLNFAISGNGNCTWDSTEINIYDGASVIAGNTAIFHPQVGTLNVFGGTITGATGIELRSGTLNVTGGVITGDNGSFAEQASGNGNSVLGPGIAVSQHTTNNNVSVSISGDAKVTGTKYALYEVDLQDESNDNVKLSVTAGTFTATSTDTGAMAIASENVTKFIAGGTLSTVVADDELVDNTTLIAHTSGTSTQYAVGDSAQTLANAAQAGDTITVLKGNNITVPNDVTVKNETGNEITVNNKPVKANGTYTTTGPSGGGGGSYTPSGHYVTSPFDGVDKVYVDSKLLDTENYTTSGGNVTLLQSYLDGLKAGTHTIKIVWGTREATGTFTTKGTGTVQSAKTFDAGIAVYAGMALSSAMGAAYVCAKKKH